MIGGLFAGARIALSIGWMLVLLPFQIGAVALGSRLAERIPVLFHRGLCRLLGVAVEVRGEPSPRRPTLFVGNHVSYLDIVVLGATVPVSFVARHDIAGWPLVGLLAKLQRSVFVERRPRHTGEQRDEMSVRLAAGDNLMLFPEGTSSDGNRLLPFKSALFSVAERRVDGAGLVVQPVSIAYTRLAGMPVTWHQRPFIAWYGDMDLASHAWQLLRQGSVGVMVEFHRPVTIDQFESRKALADYCFAVIADGVSRGHGGAAKPAVETVAAQ